MELLKPYSQEAERAVLGSLLLENELVSEISKRLKPNDFYFSLHKNIYLKILELGDAADLISVSEALNNINLDKPIIEYLSDIMALVPTTANVGYYIKILRSKAAERKLLDIANVIQEKQGQISEDILQSLKDIQDLQSDEVNENNYVPDLLGDVLQNIEDNNRRGTIPGLDTGFNKLNEYTGGWQSGRYYILGARPKMGKSSLFCQLADYVSYKTPVLIFSMEMTKDELVKLLLYQNSKIDSNLECSGKLKETDFKKLTIAGQALNNRFLYIDDKSRTIPQFISSLKSTQRECNKKGEGKIGLIVIDYVQLIHGNSRFSRNYQLEEISRSLKEIAKDYNLSVLALSMLSRSVEIRKDLRPLPSDLKDSGSFEQDCDVLMLMYRDTYYNPKGGKNTRIHYEDNTKIECDIVDINFYLNRHGPTGQIQLDFFTKAGVFIDPTC